MQTGYLGASRHSRWRWLVVWGSWLASADPEYDARMRLAIDGLAGGTYKTVRCCQGPEGCTTNSQ